MFLSEDDLFVVTAGFKVEAVFHRMSWMIAASPCGLCSCRLVILIWMCSRHSIAKFPVLRLTLLLCFLGHFPAHCRRIKPAFLSVLRPSSLTSHQRVSSDPSPAQPASLVWPLPLVCCTTSAPSSSWVSSTCLLRALGTSSVQGSGAAREDKTDGVPAFMAAVWQGR